MSADGRADVLCLPVLIHQEEEADVKEALCQCYLELLLLLRATLVHVDLLLSCVSAQT